MRGGVDVDVDKVRESSFSGVMSVMMRTLSLNFDRLGGREGDNDLSEIVLITRSRRGKKRARETEFMMRGGAGDGR